MKWRSILLVNCLCWQSVFAFALFPFDLGRQELKTDYSQTVWDRMMEEQSVMDIRRGLGEMSVARYKEASNSFAKAVIKNSKAPLPYLLLGASEYWLGKVDSAMSEYREALRLDPNNAMAYQLLAIAYGWKGDIDAAQANFLTALRLDPNKSDTHMNLGSTYAVQKNFDKALDHYRKAAELDSRQPLYQYQLAVLYEALGRDELAEDAFKRALKLFPYYEDAQLGLAALYEKLGQNKEALKYYKKAVKTKPGDYVARLRYAALLLQEGQKMAARQVLDEAFSIVAFKQEGLALNAVYRASGSQQQTFAEQLGKFKKSLENVPAGKDINVEVALDYIPVLKAAPTPQPKSSDKLFEKAYQTLRSGPEEQSAAPGVQPMSFKRSFVLSASDAKSRQTQIDEFISGLGQAVEQGLGKYQVNMSLQGRTMDYASPNALTQQNASAPRAAYDPRIVGNDMGLWVMGKGWLKLAEEIYPDLQESAAALPAENTYFVLLGLADLVTGNSAAAVQHFKQAAAIAPADDLPVLGYGTALVMSGNDEAAHTQYERVLVLNPHNKTAKRNLDVLKIE